MSEFKTVWDGLDWSILTDALFSVIPALLCITIHELCHGLVAYMLGDDTAKSQGRLTLNPIKHLDIIGLLSMAFLGFGWAKPVPIDMRKFKNPKAGMALTALAGPVSNIILAVIVMMLSLFVLPMVNGSGIWTEIFRVMQTTAYLSISLAIFNIIPVPPLDGSKVVFSFLSENLYYKLMRYERYGMIILIVLIWTGFLGTPLSRASYFVYEHIYYVLADIYTAIMGLF